MRGGKGRAYQIRILQAFGGGWAYGMRHNFLAAGASVRHGWCCLASAEGACNNYLRSFDRYVERNHGGKREGGEERMNTEETTNLTELPKPLSPDSDLAVPDGTSSTTLLAMAPDCDVIQGTGLQWCSPPFPDSAAASLPEVPCVANQQHCLIAVSGPRVRVRLCVQGGDSQRDGNLLRRGSYSGTRGNRAARPMMTGQAAR